MNIDLYFISALKKSTTKNENFISDFQNWKMADEVAKCLDLSYGTVSFVLEDEQKLLITLVPIFISCRLCLYSACACFGLSKRSSRQIHLAQEIVSVQLKRFHSTFRISLCVPIALCAIQSRFN